MVNGKWVMINGGGGMEARGFAEQVVPVSVGNLHREYPNGIWHHWLGEELVASPQRLHPAFFGCFDWHSAQNAILHKLL